MRPTDRRSTVFAPAFAVLGFLALAGASAAQPEVPGPAHPPETSLDQRIDIALQEADVSQVLASFGEIFGGEVEVDPEVRGEVTMELHHVRAATVLTAVCESVGCQWWIEDGRLKIERNPEAPAPPPAAPGRAEGVSAARLDAPINMELVDADLRETLRAFGSIVQARVSIDASLQGTVTVDLHNTPAREALDAVCRMQSCAWELQETEGGPVLLVVRRR
jgi:type II secretory pathway component GspD/PulD (secretin)